MKTDTMKYIAIIAVCAVIIAGMIIYFSPYQQCVRQLTPLYKKNGNDVTRSEGLAAYKCKFGD